jgi:hypothetical protein
MTFDELAQEYRESLIGDAIYGRVRHSVEGLLRRRDPRIYAFGSHDYGDAAEDVLNQFVLDVLIGERQIAYVMTVASTLEDFDRLIGRQLRRYLARKRQRTVVDNLLDRVFEMAADPPFELRGTQGVPRIALPGRQDGSDSDPRDADVRRAVALASAVPKDRSDASERAPRVYDAERLAAVVGVYLSEVRTAASRSDLNDFFRLLLTPWLPRFLGEVEVESVTDPDLSPEEAALVADEATRMIEAMGVEERLIFLYKHANLPDRELAERLGLSRQSTAPRKAELLRKLAEQLSDVSQRLQAPVLSAVAARLVLEEGWSS